MDIQIYKYLVIWLYGYMNICYMGRWIYIYVNLETLETHDIYDTPDMGTLNVTDRVSQ